MSTSHIVSLLIEQRDRIEAAIEALRDSASGLPTGKRTEDESIPDWVKSTPKTSTAPTVAAPKKRGMSAATRRRMAEGQKRRWATINAAEGEVVAPKKRTMSAEGRQRIIDATKARWAKINAAKAAAAAPVAVKRKTAPAKAPVKKAGLTEAGRKALSLAMKKRWAARKQAAAKKA
jgi:hypothetical protein